VWGGGGSGQGSGLVTLFGYLSPWSFLSISGSGRRGGSGRGGGFRLLSRAIQVFNSFVVLWEVIRGLGALHQQLALSIAE
jgi:hypothetical protein